MGHKMPQALGSHLPREVIRLSKISQETARVFPDSSLSHMMNDPQLEPSVT